MKLTGLWLVILAMVGGFASAAILATRRPADPFALCRLSPLKAAATTVVLIDATDSFTNEQRQRIELAVSAERDRLPEGGRMVVLALNPEAPFEPSELAAVCNPGKGDHSNPLFETRSKREKRWHAAFAEPIASAVAEAQARPASERSPIILSVAGLLARADFDARAAERRLLLISDLLEYDRSGYSQLKGGDLWSAYQGSALAKSARLNLGGVSVAIDYLQRAKFAAVQGPRHQAFWQRLFKEGGAKEVTFLGFAATDLPASGPAPAASKRLGRLP